MDLPLPLLTGVKLALSPELLAIPHIPQLVNIFLLPSTIDSAVYNDLQRAIRVFGTFRAWTVGAMDGAAALGRLDILKWLRANRMEGCSAQAFNLAAANNHLEVFYWLCEWYRGRCRVTEALVAGATGGHLQVVRFLWRWRAYRDGEAVLEAAAANGHLEVVRYLLPQHSTYAVGQRALAAAAQNNHINVVRLMLERSRQATITDHFRISAVEKAAAAGHLEIATVLVERWEVGSGDVMRVNLALVNAMEKGDIQMAKLLLPSCDSRGAIKVLPDAIEGRYTELVRLLLPICNSKGMGLAVRAAASSNQIELVKHTLAKCTSGGVVPATEMVAVQEGFLAAVDRGYIEVVKMMVERCVGYIHDAFLRAVAQSQPVMVDILLTECNARYLHYVNRAGLILAATRENIEMTRLIATKSDGITVGGVLDHLGCEIHFGVLRLLSQNSSHEYLVEALVRGALDDHVEEVQILLESCGQEVARDALPSIAPTGNIEIVKMVLKKCDISFGSECKAVATCWAARLA